MGKGRNLKAALQSQQSRFKLKEKLSHAAQISNQKLSKKAKRDSRLNYPTTSTSSVQRTAARPPRKRTIPFRETDKILLIGEGNFSFAWALVSDDAPVELRSFPPQNLTATAYDSEEKCYQKYSDAQEIVARLRERGVEVWFEVDATRLEKMSKSKGRRWDRVVWNFPHAGKGITDQDRNILSNQMLILSFFRSASTVLSLGTVPSFTSSKKKGENLEDEACEDDTVPDAPESEEDSILRDTQKTRGTVLITLRNVPPYTSWDVTRLAKRPPLPTSGSNPPNPRYVLLRSFRFYRTAYAGYEHRMTKGARAYGAGKTGEGGEDRTWEFCLQDYE